MQMYVANASTQKQLFMYRIPEQPRMRQVPIEPMGQAKLPDDLNQEQITSIVEQFEKYGIVSVDEARAKRPAKRNVSLCYSVGHPVSALVISALATKNFAVLDAMGREMRQRAAVASNAAVGAALEEQRREMAREGVDPGQLASFEATIQEEEPAGGYKVPEKEVLAEGIKVVGRTPRRARG